MTSNRPYLLRALHEWILDNAMTPYLIVNTTVAEIDVPGEFIEDDRIILNIHPDAVHDFNMSNDDISFSARFKGVSRDLYIPMSAVLAIYAKENGKGMIFPEEDQDKSETNEQAEKKSNNPRAPHLKIIK